MKLMDRKNGIAISETANPVGDSRLQAFGSGQQNLPLEDFEERILRIAFYKFPLSDSILYLKIIHPPNFREEPFNSNRRYIST